MTPIAFLSLLLATILADATPLIQPPPPPPPHTQSTPHRSHKYPRPTNSAYAYRRQHQHKKPRHTNSAYATRRQHQKPPPQPRPSSSVYAPPRQKRKQKTYYTAPITKKMIHNVTAPGVPFAGAVEFLEAHNKIRLQYNEPPLVWNKTLAEEAKKYVLSQATSCSNDHTDGPYGENTFWCGRADVFTPEKVVEKWMEEKKYFDSNTNDCKGEDECGHFTQLVWTDTKSLGCSMIACYNRGGMVTMCFYYPPGNYAHKSPFQKHLKT